MEEGGFEPPKRDATDLQSAPFGHSGTPPYEIEFDGQATEHDVLYTAPGKMSRYFLKDTAEALNIPGERKKLRKLSLFGGGKSAVSYQNCADRDALRADSTRLFKLICWEEA